MALVLLAITAVLTYLMGWLVTGLSDPYQWELWVRVLFAILWILWAMRANFRYDQKKVRKDGLRL